ncbi:sensor histidine kinase [Cohnella endophytica]|uniref:Sensor histidine kinase n=1 Tax=Cohnella endophytica TaxID=2419778 RepID=A0A494XP81_9BACL|nr:sensor histidine kinase [Cohnella endophytica]RKP49864.1 sensor histidine kinase [Cohnella endophytica]
MRRYMNTMSLKSKITLAFVCFILLPFGILGMYSYDQSQRYMRAQAISNSQTTAKQIKYAIENKIDLIESVSNNITYNYRLQSFLGDPYSADDISLDNYFNYASPLLNYAMLFQKVNIQKISVYMTNKTIPEGFGAFYYEEKLRKEPWYDAFIRSESKSRWLFRPGAAPSDDLYSFAQKMIAIDGKELGVTVVDVNARELLGPAIAIDGKQSIRIEDERRTVLALQGRPIEDGDWPLLGTGGWPADESYVRSGGHLFVAESLNGVRLSLILATEMPPVLMSLQVATNWAFIATLLVLLYAFYSMLKMMLRKMKRSIEQMDQAIESGFRPIPIERNDEFGVISERFNLLLGKVTGLMADAIRKETIHKDAQLIALQSQINPHFIYNTLDIFSAKMELAGQFDVSEAMTDFGKMMRYNMDGQSKFTTLEAELRHLEQYVSLQRVKYGDRLRVRIDVPASLLPIRVIKFILQPIVENSIKHGFFQRDSLTVEVVGSLDAAGRLKIVVRDDGIGIAEQRLTLLNERFRASQYAPIAGSDRESIGLGNINERLKLFYGTEYPLRMNGVEGRFAETEITIPCNMESLEEINHVYRVDHR